MGDATNSTFKYSFEPVKEDKISHVVNDWIEFDSCWERGGRVQVPCTRTRSSSCRGDSFSVQTPPRDSNTLHKLINLSHSGQQWRQSIRQMALNLPPLRSPVSFKSSDRPSISYIPTGLVDEHRRVEGHRGGSCDILSHWAKRCKWFPSKGLSLLTWEGERCMRLINIQMPTACISHCWEQNEGSNAFNTSFPRWSPTVPTSCCLSACVVFLCPSKLNALAQEKEPQEGWVASRWLGSPSASPIHLRRIF